MPRVLDANSTQVTADASSRGASAIVVAAAVGLIALSSAAIALWFHYGTAVFFTMIASGIAACF